jgi:hypothetical protein
MHAKENKAKAANNPGFALFKNTPAGGFRRQRPAAR